MLPRQARDNRQDGVRKRLVGKRSLAAELLLDHALRAGLGHQFEAQQLRSEARHLFVRQPGCPASVINPIAGPLMAWQRLSMP